MKSMLVGLAVLLTFGAALAEDPILNGAEVVKNAKWDAMETLTVELSEHEFSPNELKFRANQPYRLIVKNLGEKDHYFTATEFFKGVAWRKVQTPKPHGGEIKAPYFTAIEAYKNGGSVELFFVPVRKGNYEVVCTIDDHKEKGMTGRIIVE